MLGGTLVMVDRNIQKAKLLRKCLENQFDSAEIYNITADLEDIKAVSIVCDEIIKLSVDVVIHNAGAYRIPRKICSTGFDNIFQINFVSPYYITNRLLPYLKAREGGVVIVGSIAHNYSKTDENDIDFSTRKKHSLIYGNAKRYLMFSSILLARKNSEIFLSITHPGITFTNITAHYPKWIFALIKYPMKIIFMSPKKAALNIMCGIFRKTEGFSWIGPRIFNVWGLPKNKKLKTCSEEEAKRIYNFANDIYIKINSEKKELLI